MHFRGVTRKNRRRLVSFLVRCFLNAHRVTCVYKYIYISSAYNVHTYIYISSVRGRYLDFVGSPLAPRKHSWKSCFLSLSREPKNTKYNIANIMYTRILYVQCISICGKEWWGWGERENKRTTHIIFTYTHARTPYIQDDIFFYHELRNIPRKYKLFYFVLCFLHIPFKISIPVAYWLLWFLCIDFWL